MSSSAHRCPEEPAITPAARGEAERRSDWADGRSLGIMQPYLFPYLGYFQLIHASERWIVFDTAQYIRHGWVNRNRVLHPSNGWQYILAPVAKHARETPIREVALADKRACQERIEGQLAHYKKHAPFFSETMQLLAECFAGDETRLAALNVRSLRLCCERIGLAFDPRPFSTMNLQLGPIEGPGDWALRIAEASGAARYVNAPSGAEIFDPERFAAAGIDFRLLQPGLAPYPQGARPFEPALSILDAFMWNAPETVRTMVEDYELTSPRSR